MAQQGVNGDLRDPLGLMEALELMEAILRRNKTYFQDSFLPSSLSPILPVLPSSFGGSKSLTVPLGEVRHSSTCEARQVLRE